MTAMRHVLTGLCLCLGLILAQPASAQTKAPTAEALTLAKDLLAAMGADKQMDTMIPLMMQSMRGVIIQQKPGAQGEVDAALAALTAKFATRRQEMLDLVAIVYAERVPIEDMKAMAAFFASPAGKRFVLLQPELMRESAVVGQKWGARIGQEVEAELRQELKRRGVDL